MKKYGVRFDENMYGTFHRVGCPDDPRPFMFHLVAQAPTVRGLIWNGRMRANGHVQADGFARHAKLTGELTIRPLVRRIVRYEFEFTADDGKTYRYAGQKSIRHLNPMRTWTTLPGAIYDADGKMLYESTSRFDLTELLPFIRSYQLTAG